MYKFVFEFLSNDEIDRYRARQDPTLGHDYSVVFNRLILQYPDLKEACQQFRSETSYKTKKPFECLKYAFLKQT